MDYCEHLGKKVSLFLKIFSTTFHLKTDELSESLYSLKQAILPTTPLPSVISNSHSSRFLK